MIVSTKLHIPQVRNSLVPRPRLTRMLNEGMEAKLTLISAQAGYGKTTDNFKPEVEWKKLIEVIIHIIDRLYQVYNVYV